MNRDPYKILFYTTLLLIVLYILVHAIRAKNYSMHEAIDRTLITMDDEVKMIKINKTYDMMLTGKELKDDLSFNCTQDDAGTGLYHVVDVSDSYSHLRPLVGERLLQIDGVGISSSNCTKDNIYDFNALNDTKSYTASFDVSNTLIYMNPEFHSLGTFSTFGTDIYSNMISFFKGIHE